MYTVCMHQKKTKGEINNNTVMNILYDPCVNDIRVH